jgi:hypothetical protein|tara:strand:- start:279 stop:455 length:177 start_codon:yes stop_codon:yes gene_type:complete
LEKKEEKEEGQASPENEVKGAISNLMVQADNENGDEIELGPVGNNEVKNRSKASMKCS